MRSTDKPIVIEQSFNRTAEVVWDAITEHGHMIHWFFDNIPEFKPIVGFKTQFAVRSGEREFLHKWEILTVIPLKKITYDWRYENYSGVGEVTFELLEQGSLTTLRLTNIIKEDFVKGIPEFTRESCIGGWEYFIQQRLKAYIESL